MNAPFIEEPIHSSDIIEESEKNIENEASHSDAYLDKVPAGEAFAYEMSMSGAVATINRMEDTRVNAIPIAMASPAAEADLVEEVTAPEAPTALTTPYAPITNESRLNKTAPYTAPLSEKAMTHEAPAGSDVGSLAALLNREESERFRTRWNAIQGRFVDDPRSAVQQADELVTEVVEQITHMFSKVHGELEVQWNQGNDVYTEDLRKALQHYRSFFNRLVV